MSPSSSRSGSSASRSSSRSRSSTSDTSQETSSDDSDMSTPYRAGASTMVQHDVDTMKKFLKIETNNHTYRAVSVKHFVTNVWGLDETDADTIISSSIAHSPEELASYTSVLGYARSKEIDLHKPFRDISQSLLTKVCSILHKDPGSLQTDFWDGKGTTMLISEFTGRKPDLVRFWTPMEDIRWHFAKAPLEFKKPHGPKSWLDTIAEEGGNAASSSSTSQLENPPPQAKKRPKKSERRSKVKQSSSTSTSTSGSTKEAEPGQKRSRDGAEDNNGARDRKRNRTSLTQDELQVASYILECFGSSNRHFVTGILAEGTRISLWYFDRVAVIRTQTFQLDDAAHGAQFLALALYALDQADMSHSGFNPHIYEFTAPSDHEIPVTEACISPLERPAHEESTSLCFRLPKQAPTQKDYIFQIKKFLFKYRGIMGRGTLVAAIQIYTMNECLYRDHCVIKLSWQYTSRQSEGGILAALRKAIPAWTNNLPNPIFHATYNSAELGIPRSKMELTEVDSTKPIKDRDLHVLVSDMYKNLWEADDVEEFKRIFLDCIECHYHAYTTGRVLHRDISENNLMIWRPVNEVEVDSEGSASDSDSGDSELEDDAQKSFGILNDFDMAVGVDAEGRSPPSGASHRTGTLPFMATGLLDKKMHPGSHFYRYDLESFFYILVWAAVHYDLKLKQHIETPEHFRDWADYGHAHKAKSSFFINSVDDDSEAYECVFSEFKSVWNEWIYPLHKLFGDAFIHQARHRRDEGYIPETIDALITFETFMETIGVKPRGLEREER
ncbi:hypothetical protein CPB84DRAFT_374602 [Gymnopilus junonius]|uniref:Fungal-type protein kinase domain-containing protein n=1 Tax=Gymnopilus junonius TaxID=109634 RepID=A0A9P5NBM1_GYMJU|nr:hypothetical protein CPB84DRAFT_374602 [Gymnopilus junonius]